MLRKLSEISEILRHPTNAKARTNAFFRYIKWNIGRRLLNDVNYVVPLTDRTQVILSNTENYATLAYLCGLYDFEDMQFFRHALRQGDIFADLGANVGVYSVLAGATGAAVLSVEPVPQTFSRLLDNLRLNAVSGTPVCCGLSNANGTLRFTTHRGGMNRVATANEPDSIEVEVTTVDDLTTREKLRPHFMKIDVEGYELPLLEGAKRTLESVLALVIELNGSGGTYGRSDDDVHALLSNCGFDAFSYNPDIRQLTKESTYRRGKLNTLYVSRARISELRTRLAQ